MQNKANFTFYFSHVLLSIAVAAGLFVRLTALGHWPLAEDEYYLAKSIGNILQKGLPAFDCGGYYVRGLLQQYLTAPMMLLSPDPEWAVRIVPVLSNVAAIPAVYLLGKRLGGYPVAIAAAALFSLSIWEIEFARFGRMYAPFQAVFLWYLVFLAKAILDKRASAMTWMYCLSFVSLFLYEGAIFLVLLNLVPFVMGRQRSSLGHLLLSFGLLIATVIYEQIDLLRVGTSGQLPAANTLAYEHQRPLTVSTFPISLPPTLLGTLAHSPLWLFFSIFPLVVSGRAVVRLWRTADMTWHEQLLWTLVLMCSIVNLFGLGLELAVLGFLFGTIPNVKTPARYYVTRYRWIILTILINGLFWLSYGLTSRAWLQPLGPDTSRFHELAVIFFEYPDFYHKVLVEWFGAMPHLTSAVLLISVGGLLGVILRRDPEQEATRLFLGILLGIVMIVGSLHTIHISARYTFFLYPVLLLVCCTVLKELAYRIPGGDSMRASVFYALVGIFAYAGEDFGIAHLKNIASAEVNFRTIYGETKQSLYYPRNDYASPARYINAHAGANDIILSEVPVEDFYLNRLDFKYANYQGIYYAHVSACGGTRDRWSNAALIDTEKGLLKLIETSDRPVWLILYRFVRQQRPIEEYIKGTYKQFIVYTSIDKTIDVYRIGPPPERFIRSLKRGGVSGNIFPNRSPVPNA